MKAPESFGRCNTLTSSTAVLLAVLWAVPCQAESGDVRSEATLDVAEGGWSGLVDDKGMPLPLDEQIFTEISPILATDNGVRLPEDQAEE
jgi:hypothetical protein